MRRLRPFSGMFAPISSIFYKVNLPACGSFQGSPCLLNCVYCFNYTITDVAIKDDKEEYFEIYI